MCDKDHTLNELIEIWTKHSDLIKEDFKKNPLQEGEDYFNLPNALLCLAKNIKVLNSHVLPQIMENE